MNFPICCDLYSLWFQTVRIPVGPNFQLLSPEASIYKDANCLGSGIFTLNRSMIIVFFRSVVQRLHSVPGSGPKGSVFLLLINKRKHGLTKEQMENWGKEKRGKKGWETTRKWKGGKYTEKRGNPPLATVTLFISMSILCFYVLNTYFFPPAQPNSHTLHGDVGSPIALGPLITFSRPQHATLPPLEVAPSHHGCGPRFFWS